MIHRACTAAIVIASCCLLVAPSANAQAVLNPPFGLRWGDSPEKLVTWASQQKLDLSINLPGKSPGLQILKINPESGFLPGTKARSVEGRFLDGKLYELTVHYTDPTTTADVIESRFEELRKQITVEYGKLLSNQHQRSVKDQFVTRTQSFHREPVKGLFLLLVYTEIEDLLRKSTDARFSLVYRNDNFRQELEAALKQP